MSLLTKNTTPAERRVGCNFIEKFENNSAVARNNGVVTGAPAINNGATFDGTTDYITYGDAPDLGSDNFSFVFTFSVPSTGTQEYLFSKWEDVNNRWYIRKETAGQIFMYCLVGGAIRISALSGLAITEANREYHVVVSGDWSDTIRFYIDGVESTGSVATFTNDDITNTGNLEIGHAPAVFGEFTMKKLVIYNSMTPESVALSLYNNSTYTYRNEALVDLPMTAATHDPTNVRTLDVSGNGHNATFGDGSTSTTYPTKLAKRGFSFDGGDYFEIANAADLNFGDGSTDSPFSVSALVNLTDCSSSYFVSKVLVAGNGQYIFGINPTDTLYSACFDENAGAGYIGRTAGSFTQYENQWTHVVLTYDGSSTSAGHKIYVNALQVDSGDNAGGSYTAMHTDSNDVAIGRYSTAYLKGDMKEFQMFDFVLSPTQIADLHIQLMQSINNI